MTYRWLWILTVAFFGVLLFLVFSRQILPFQEATVQTKGVTVLSILLPPQTLASWKPLLDEFHRERPEIGIDLIEGPSSTGSLEDMVNTAFLSGERQYDLVWADIIWLPKLISMGWLLPLDDVLPKQEQERFFPQLITACSSHDHLYRVSLNIDYGVLYYRRDLLDSRGIAPPATFRDLIRISEIFKNDGYTGFTWQGKQYEGLVCNFLEVLTGFGGFWIDPISGTVGLDKPEALASVDFYMDCLYRSRISPPGVITYDEEGSRRLFHEGKALFHRNWPYVWSTGNREDSPIQGRIGVVPFVNDGVHSSASTLGGWGLCLSRLCPAPDAAKAFIRFMASEKVMKTLYENDGSLPARRTLYMDPDLAQFVKIGDCAKARPPVTQYPQASDILQRYLSAALSRKMDVTAAMRKAASETRMLLNR